MLKAFLGNRKSRQLFLDQSREETRSNRQCLVVEIVMRVVDRTAAYATGIANIDKGTRASLKHVCEVFGGRNKASIPIDVRLAATSAMNAVSAGLLTSGANTSGNSTLAVAPKAPATPAAVRRMQSSICFMVSLLNVRNVPRITAVSGMTL
jgi:hypothetical protein